MALQGGLTIAELFGGAMLLVGGFVLVVSARYIWRATAVIRATERTELNTSDAGTLTRISGDVTQNNGESLVAPFSGTDCVALRYQIEERRLSVLYLFPWYVTVHEATGAVAFDVQTEAGTIPVVEPARTVALSTEVVATTGSSTEPPDRIHQFEQESDNVPLSTVWRDPPSVVRPLFSVLSIGTRRYSEQRAAVGDELTVVGQVTDGGSGIDPLVVSDRSPVGTVFRMAKTSLGGLLIGVVGLLLGVFLLIGL
jgi:hypothetical protein